MTMFRAVVDAAFAATEADARRHLDTARARTIEDYGITDATEMVVVAIDGPGTRWEGSFTGTPTQVPEADVVAGCV